MFLPTEAPDRVAVAPAPDVAAMVKDYKGKAELAAGEDFDPSPANIEARTKLTTIPGTGIKAALLTKKTRGQTVQLRLTLRYGDENSLKGYVQSAGFLPDLMARATKNLSRQALADALDASRTTLTADGGAGRLTISMQTRRPSVPAALDLLRQVLREPALPEAELDILKRATLARLEQDRTQPTALVDNTIARKLRPFAADDVRYQPSIEEEVERTRGVTIDKVKKLYQDFIGSSHGELVVVGDFDEAALAPAVESMLRDWRPRTPYARIVMPAAVSLPAADLAIPTPDKANAQYGAAFSLPVSDAAQGEYPALLMANRILGGSGTSRLWVRVRETEGLSYGVRSYLSASPLDPYANLTISAIVNPANMPKLRTVMDAELRKLLEQGVTDQELKRAKDSWLEQRQVSRSQDPALAGLLAEHLYAGRSIRYEAELEENVRGLTPDQVLAAARKYLDLGRRVVVNAGDFQAHAPQGAGAAGGN